jgi:hypothetical protein
MKKIISKVLVTVMLVSLFVLPVQAETVDITTPNDRIKQFVDNVWELENRDEFVNMLILLRNVDDEAGFIQVYTAMFNGLLPGQQDRLNSFGATLTAVTGFGKYVMNEDFSPSNLESYLGLDDGPNGTAENKEAFYNALLRRKTEFEAAVSGVSDETLDRGFERMDMLFDMLKLVQVLKDSDYDVAKYSIRFLHTPQAYGVLTLDRAKAGIIVVAANLILKNQIEQGETVVDGVQVLVDYYNLKSNTQDRRRIFDYLSRYGFIEIRTTTPATPATPATPGTPGTPATPAIPAIPANPGGIDIEDEDIAESGLSFEDLGKFQWAVSSIRQLFLAGVIKGKSSTLFDPSGHVTRAEFAAMLTRMFGLVEPESIAEQEAVFEDVKKSDWFMGEVIAAYQGLYIHGFGNKQFKPNDKITREQIAVIVTNVLKAKGLSLTDLAETEGILKDFTDNLTVSEWAKISAATAAKYGIVNGVVAGNKKSFEFKKNATRAEVAVMLYRLAKLVETKVSTVE